MNKIAEIMYGKVANLYETSRTLEEMKALFVPAALLVDVTDVEDIGIGYAVDYGSGLETPNFIPPPKILPQTLEEAKVAKLAEIDAWTAAKITGGFVSNASGEAVTYDSDKDTQLTMQGIALNVNTELFAEKYPDGCPVRGYPEGSDTKQIYMLSPAQVMQWQADLSIHIGTCKQNGWAKQAEVAAAQSKEEVEAIELDSDENA